MPPSPRYKPSAAHLALGNSFYDEVRAAVFPEHILRFRNQAAARQTGLETLDEAEWISHFGHFQPLPGTLEYPLALRYHGHQFRHYNPDLGDGRGFLFAQLYDLQDGRLLDLGTKGSGQTPWSRAGDGRLTLRGGVREVLAAGMLEALGVNTSRAFSLIETGEALQRHDEPSPARSSVLVRLSHSHIRIGTFQRLAALQDRPALEKLVAYVLETYFPQAAGTGDEAPAITLLRETTRRVAQTGAQWMAAGFVHGVLNTDNINITGESFDYGPWRFLPSWDDSFTAAYFDHSRLYAYGRQPETLLWNLARLAESLIELASYDDLVATLEQFPALYHDALDRAWLRRLGLASRGAEKDRTLREAVSVFLRASGMPFACFPFDWFGGGCRAEQALQGPRASFYLSQDFAPLRAILEEYTSASGIQTRTAFFAREAPPDILTDTMDAIWTPIAKNDDWSVFYGFLNEIEKMKEAYSAP
ncbi:YdiU family protein [Acetobacter sp. AN02]|uniref:protein adenylyltransferase SelO family protein n=1 Tax=Acetobacter sp. AN02 TaxID=2894186 RepID=UPI00243417D3|nr:YdiU family protein [Acetobacter sp. AN02]MDG6093548.1 YdiU family protein [Acetobacter sp. AN02]